jgi:V8-like Glu-specific endopeptidase
MGGQQRYGTGFLIGKNLVLTCAHNLFSLDYGQAVENVCFSPGYGGGKEK